MGHDRATRLTELTTRFIAERHGLMAYISTLVRDPVAAEDLFQEVYLRLADACARGVMVEDPPRWFRGVARNLILHRWRDERRARVIVDSELLDLVEIAFTEEDPQLEELERRRHGLEECLLTLPEHARELLRLTYAEHLTSHQVATRLRQSSASVLMSLSRLRRLLEECITRRLQASS